MKNIPNKHRPDTLATSYPAVAIIIVTYNKIDFVLTLLKQLTDYAYPNTTVFVVDNNSRDGTPAVIRSQFPQINLIETGANLGGTGGFNHGLKAVLKHGSFKYVWLLDNDVEIKPGALEVLIETLEKRPDAAVAGSHIMQLDNPHVTNEIGAYVDLAGGRLLLNQHGTREWMHSREIYEVDYVAACSMLVRANVLKQVGLLDDFFIHYDDVDWCLRIKKQGHKVLACAASRIMHISANAKSTTWILYYDLRNILYLQHKHGNFGLRHYSKFAMLFLLYSIRDELCGKTEFGWLRYYAFRDFLHGNMGKCDSLPDIGTVSLKNRMDEIMDSHPTTILIQEPLKQVLFDKNETEHAAARGIDIISVCNSRESRFRGAPHTTQHLRLPENKILMAVKLVQIACTRRKADYLFVEIDRPCGLLGLGVKRIIHLVNGRCREEPGGFRRLLGTWRWPVLWFRLLARLLLFKLRHKKPVPYNTRQTIPIGVEFSKQGRNLGE